MMDENIYLIGSDGTIFGKLNRFINDDSCKLNLNDWNVISFKIRKYKNPYYDKIKKGMRIDTDSRSYKIDIPPVINVDSNGEYKEVSCSSLECELNQFNLGDTFKINTGEDGSYEYLDDNNLDEYGVAKNPIIVYNKDNPDLSLLDIVLSKAPGWKVGTVDPVLAEERYQFSGDCTVYDFLRNDLQKVAKCIVSFDTKHKLINLKKIDDVGINTGIIIKLDKLIKELNISPYDKDIFTKYTVSGAEGLSIRNVNFGSDAIVNIDYFMQSPWVNSQSTIDKYNIYKNTIEELRPQYKSYAITYAEALDKSSDLYNRQPIDEVKYDWYDYTIDELDEQLDRYNSMINVIESTPDYQTNGIFDIEKLRNNQEYYSYICFQSILSDITYAKEHYNDEKQKLQKSWETKWELFGLSELKVQIDLFNEQLSSLSQYAKSWDQLTESEKAESSISQTLYNTYHNTYVTANTNLSGCNTEYINKKTLYDSYISIMNSSHENMASIAASADISNSDYGFTEDELLTIKSLYNETSYSNENIVYNDLYNNVEEIDIEQELFDDAKEKLDQNSQLQVEFTTSINNILRIPKFKYFIKYLDVGNFCLVEDNDGILHKLRIVSIEYHPLTLEDDISISFSTMIKNDYGISDSEIILDNELSHSKSSSTSTSSSSISSNGSKDGVPTSMIKGLINSSFFNGHFDTLAAQIAYINSINAKTIVTNYIESNVANIGSLIFDTATGQSITTKFANTVISQVGIGQIKDAMIETLSVEKILAGDISTTKFNIVSDSGKMLLSDDTIQISDDNHVRVQIGKDASNDYNMYVWDASGKLMFDASGLTEDGIKKQIIRNDMISDTANINAGKLNIDSLFSEINGSTNKLNASSVKLDKQNQTLDVAFTSILSDVNNLSTNVIEQGTAIGVIQGNITSKIWQSDIDTATENISNQYTTLLQDLTGFKTTVSSTYATTSDVDNLQGQIDGNINTWTGAEVPVLTNYPANEWKTNDLKNIHIGDLYYVESNSEQQGYCYRFQYVNGVYSWVLLKDSDVTKAVQEATEAKSIANNVNNDLTTNYYNKTSTNSVIEQSATQILSTVSSTYATQEGLNSANSSIQQQADIISSKVSKNDVISSINQSAETISINASKVNLTGAVTFNSFNNELKTTINTTSQNANTALSTANAASTSATEAKNAVENYAKTAVDWVNSNGTNQTNLSSMVKQWTDNAVSDTTQINGGWIKTNTITADKLVAEDIVGTNGWINLRNGTFNYGNGKLIWDGSQVTINGNIESINGHIGGMTLSSSAIYNGTNSMTSTVEGIYLGTQGFRQYTSNDAYVNIQNGILNAKGVDIDGKISANDGSIAGWKIGDRSTGINFTSDDGLTSITMRPIQPSTVEDWSRWGVFQISKKSSATASWTYPFIIRADGSAEFSDITIKGGDISLTSANRDVSKFVITSSDSVLNVKPDGTIAHSSYNGEKEGRYRSTLMMLLDGNTPVVDLRADNGSISFFKYKITFNSGIQSDASINCDSNVFAKKFGSAESYSNEFAIYCKWKDGNNHNIVSRGTDGLTSYFGWYDNSYKSVTNIRGRTITYSNSSGTSTLSDERLKTNFMELDDYDDVYMALDPYAFNYKKGDSGRFHFGFKAGQVKDSLIDNGFSTKDFAGFVQMTDNPDNEDYCGYDDPMALIYTEFVAWNTHMIQKEVIRNNAQDNTIDSMQQEIDELKAQVQELLSLIKNK